LRACVTACQRDPHPPSPTAPQAAEAGLSGRTSFTFPTLATPTPSLDTGVVVGTQLPAKAGKSNAAFARRVTLHCSGLQLQGVCEQFNAAIAVSIMNCPGLCLSGVCYACTGVQCMTV
jgi:hypothetical protein